MSYLCTCGEKFESLEVFRAHRHPGVYKCWCGATFESLRDIRVHQHKKKQEAEKRLYWECTCGEAFYTKRQLRDHIIIYCRRRYITEDAKLNIEAID